MLVLGIETSCDDTSVAIVRDGQEVLTNLVSSQVKAHRLFGGVVPELASRMHVEKINALIRLALQESGLTFQDLDACAVTYGPGLEGALLVGVSAASALSKALGIPLVGVNHLHAHLYASFLQPDPPEFPFLACLVSGGHTLLIHAKGHFDFESIGQTRDDAAGEAFDKVARALGLPYPGGPIIEKLALDGNAKAFAFPRAMWNQGLDFSFSGLKTAVMQVIKSYDDPSQLPVADICASFQLAVCDIIVHKSMKASQSLELSTLVLCGGVSANRCLQTELLHATSQGGLRLCVPNILYCTDNAAMVAVTGYYELLMGRLRAGPLSVVSTLHF